MEKHPWKGLKLIVFSPSKHWVLWSEWKNIPGRVWNPPWHRRQKQPQEMVRMEKHPWKGLKRSWRDNWQISINLSEWKNIPGRVWNFSVGVFLFKQQKVRMEKHPWKGLKHNILRCFKSFSFVSEWKNIPGRVWNFTMTGDLSFGKAFRQNGKTSLEGFETYMSKIRLYSSNVCQNGKTSLEGFETLDFPYRQARTV